VTPDTSVVDYDELRPLSAAHRLISEVIELAGGSVPGVGTPAWWCVELLPRIAGRLVLIEARLIDDPERIAAEQLKAVLEAISAEQFLAEYADTIVTRRWGT
jgi:hypothetical protein